MSYVLRGSFVGLLLLLLTATVNNLHAQCVGLPTVTTLGSNKVPAGFCSPVSAQISYNVGFISNIPSGTVDIVFDWGDGTTNVVNRAAGTNAYNATMSHLFPVDSDCEFLVTIHLRHNGVICPTTRQIQRVASWRTDAFNGGNVQLISPVTGTNEHLVCQGQPVNVVFNDITNFNCNSAYVHTPPTAIETPNIEHRWQHLIYNTVNEGGGISVIPNVSVNGVAVTNGTGAPIISNLPDSRGVNYMAAPVVINDPRRRNSLAITAPGGFGPGFPQVGDVFELRIRYWNFCNPYSNNSGNPTVPVSGSAVNGDNAPVERIARVRIVAAPPTLTGSDQTVCNGTTPGAFTVGNVQAGNLIIFRRDNAGVPGTVIRSNTNPSLPITSHPNWSGNPVAGQVYRVWVSQRPNVVGSCESQPILLTRTIRTRIDVPDPTPALPTEICNRDGSNNPNTFTLTLPAAAATAVGGATEYVWNTSLSPGITLTTAATGGNSATYQVNVSFGPGELFVDRTVRITRRYTSNPQCGVSRTFNIRVYNTAVGGTPSVVPDVCETTPVGTITLSGHRGEIVGWQVSLDGGPFNNYTGPASGNSITPGLLTDGTYRFRAVVRSSSAFASGPCGPVFSTERQVIVFDNPDPATAGPDQNFCGDFLSDPLGGSDPGSGTGVWSYVSSVPAGLPTPTFTANDRNTTISVLPANAGAYVMRWTVQNGSCVSFDEITVDFGGDPTDPVAGPPKDVCGVSTNLEGNTPVIGFGKWSLVGTPPGGTADIINDTSPTATINLTGTPVFGTYTFRWTITSGSCPSEEDEVDVTFFELPVAIASDVATECIDPAVLAPIDLTGTIDDGAVDAVWENVSGNGTVSATNLAGGNYEAQYIPTVDDYNTGLPIRVKLVASPVAGSPCSPNEREILINIERTPVVVAGPDVPNICGDAIQLNAQNPPPFGATGVWTSSDPSVTIDNPNQANTFVRNLPAAPSTVTMTWTLTSAGGLCSASGDVILDRVSPPALTPITPMECEVLPPGGPVVTTIVLDNYVASIPGLPASNSITWYRDATPPVGTVVPDPTIPINNIGNGQVFVARVTDLTTNCQSDVQVTIGVRALPPAQDAIVGICETDPVNFPNIAEADLTDPAFVDQVTGGAANVSIRWYPTFADAQNNTNEIIAPVTVNMNRVVHARVEYTDVPPSCPDFAEVELRVNSIPNVTSIGGDPTVCMGLNGQDINTLQISTYQVPSIPGAQYHWNIPQGAGQFVVFAGGTTSDFFALIKFPYASPAPVETISVRIEFNGCSTPDITMDIERSEVPVAPDITGTIVVCENSQSVQFDVVAPDANADYIWEIQRESDGTAGGAFISSGQSTESILVNFLAENVIISVKEENGSNGECVGPKTFHQVTVNRLPLMDNQLWTTCSGTDSGIEFQQAVTSPATIDYYNLSSFTIDPNLTFPLPGPVVGNGDFDMLRDFQFKNVTEVPLKVTYKISPVSEETVGPITLACFGPEQTVVLDVNPEPTLESGLGRNVCSEESTQITLRTSINSYPADKYVITSIEQTTNPGNPIVRVGPAAPENTDLNADAIFNDTWVNPGSNVQDSENPFIVTYRISAKNSVTGCQGTPSVPVAVAVYPKPAITFTADPVCSETNVGVELEASNVSGANTAWSWTVQSSTTNLRGAEPGTSPSGNTALIDDQIINESFTPGTVVYRVTAVTTLGGKVCSSILPVSVDINPKPQVTPIPNTPICSTTPNNGLIRETDLTTLEATIANPATTDIVWFDADPETNPGATIGDPTNYPVQNAVPVYAVVTDNAFGCAAIVPVTYTVNNALAIQLTETNVTCNGANNGSILAEVTTGGTAPFFFRRDTEPFVSAPGTSYAFLALAPDVMYNITVEDSKGCAASLTSQLITEPTPLILTSTDVTPVECFFDNNLVKDRNGRVEFIATGSSGNYTYTLFPGGATNQTGIFDNLRPGSYSVVVNDFGNVACKIEFSPVIVSVPDPIEVLPVVIPTDSDGNQISCAGATNGEVHVTARGGTGEFDFTINPANPQNPIHELADVPAVFTGLGAGTYSITIVDGNGCIGPQTSATITNILDLFPGKIGTDQDVCFQQPDAAGDAEPFTEVILPFGGPSSNYEYVWQEAVNGGPFFEIPGATSATYDPDGLNPFAFEGQFQYRRLIRSVRPVVDLDNRPAFCDDFKGENDIVTINVRPKPMVTIIGNGFTCQGNDEFYSLRLDVGTAPVRFSWFDGDFTFNNQTANQLSAPYKVSNIQNPLTVGFSNVSDSYGCIADDAMIDIDILSVDADFSVDALEKCAGDPFEFTYNNQPGVQYVWEFGDGTTRSFPADDPALDGTEGHTYAPAASSSGDATFIVKLTAALDGGACPNFTFQSVTVKQAILLNIIGAPNQICSGQTITMTDNSTGVSSGIWYTLDEHGNRGPDIAGPLSQVTFQLDNTGPDNPLNYTIHYESENAFGCNGPAYSFPVTVYRAVDADFTINPNPAQMLGGLVNVTYTNTSDPLDPAFTYVWDYKEDVESVVENGFDRELVYSSDKQRDITLTVTNPLRPQCTDTHVVTLNVDIENPMVDFRATRAGCYPLTVTVQNLSVSADKFLWELSSTNGTNEKSSLREPTFNIYDPGTYTLTLTAQKEGNPNFIQVLSKTIEVFPKPLADFFLRQNQAYTGSLIKPVNQSQFTCGDCYTWDFGDGFTYDNVFEPTHQYSLEGKYTVKLYASVDYGIYDINDDGTEADDEQVICTDETEQEIRIIDGGAVKIPNAFTPNVNGPSGGIQNNNFTNDVFLPIMEGVEEFTMQIFDRWGNMIFQSTEPNIGWDGYDKNGRLMPAGVYVYKLVMRLGDGQRTTKVGDVTLIR